MEKIEQTIKDFLSGAKSVVFLAVGSDLRADDAAGIECAKELLKNKLPENFKVMLGYTAPENLTGEIKRARPTHLIICDAAEFGAGAGEVNVIKVEDIDGDTISTHMMPISVFVDYISENVKVKALILGIQPKTIEFGAEMSEAVKKSSVNLAKTIYKLI